MFSSPEAALRFAFRMREKSIISTGSNVFMSKDKIKSPNSVKLTAYDFHAQAGLIFGRINRMPERQQAWIYMTYGNGKERSASAELLCPELLNTPEAIKYAMTKGTIKQVLLSKSVRQCAKYTGLTNYKSWKVRGALHYALEPLMLQTLDDLWVWLNPEKVACK